jgi:hypothetical protein
VIFFTTKATATAYLDQFEHYRRASAASCTSTVDGALLIEIGRVPLSRIMRGLQLRYTGYFSNVGRLCQAVKQSSVTETLMAFILSQRFLKSQSRHQLA